jgi:hypothetical protein
MQRRLIKSLEDLASQYDGTVRNSLGHIVQFKVSCGRRGWGLDAGGCSSVWDTSCSSR